LRLDGRPEEACMRCEQAMKRDAEFVTATETVQMAAQRMRRANVAFLPVCDASTGKVIGAITDRDIALRVVGHGCSPMTRVASVVTDDVLFCRPSDDLERAELLMSLHRKSRMLVIGEAGELLGVISFLDVAIARATAARESVRKAG
jgi:CBS domain-containing protein